MRMGTLAKSDLISAIGFDGHPGTQSGTLRIEYRSDGKSFEYSGVSYAIYRKLVLSKNPGKDWLKIRDNYKHREALKQRHQRLCSGCLKLMIVRGVESRKERSPNV